MEKFYKIYPCGYNGKLYWKIEYEDETKELIPFDPTDTTIQRIEEKTNKYLINKRLEKINKLLKNVL
jgi:Golgi nucleoside diphosphatase